MTSTGDGDAALLVVDNVSTSLGGRPVLKSVSLTVGAGEAVVLVGPSGAGKSTLCRAVNRLVPVDSGRILLDGEPIPEGGPALARLRTDVGMVFQHFNLFTHRTVLENVTLAPVAVRGASPDDATTEALELLARVGVVDQADKRPEELSGGQQQRVAIARSLAMHPRLMLFDEPTSALDPEMVAEVLDVMADLAADGMTMLVVTHEMGFARRAADRIVLMVDGEIVEASPPEQFFTAPRTSRAREFLGKMLPR